MEELIKELVKEIRANTEAVIQYTEVVSRMATATWAIAESIHDEANEENTVEPEQPTTYLNGNKM